MKQLMFSLLVMMISMTIFGQNNPQRIVFDVTSTDTKVHKSTMLMMKVMSKDYPDSVFEVIVYGEALPMLLKNQSTVSTEITAFANNENVIFTACEVSMELLFKVDESALLEGVGTVKNAVPDIAMKQQSGWGYIKVSN